MIIDFETAKIRKWLMDFSKSGALPEYLKSREFKNQYSNIRILGSYWEHVLQDENLSPLIREIVLAYEKFEASLPPEESEERNLCRRLEQIKESFQTCDSNFRSPTIHSGYPYESNPICVLAYEASRAFHEKMGDSAPSRTNAINIFILSFLKKHGDEILSALEHDLALLHTFISDLRDVMPHSSDPKLRVKTAALYCRDEFIVSQSTLRTILHQIKSEST